VTHRVLQNLGQPFFPLVLVMMLGAVLSGCASAPKTQSADASVSAGEPRNADRLQRHIYAGIGVGISRLSPDTGDAPNFDVSNESSQGGQLTLGMDFSPLLSFEGHVAGLGSAELSPDGDIQYGLAGLSALFYAGKNRKHFKRRGFTAYGRLALSALSNSASDGVPYEKDNSTHVGIGAGLEYMTNSALGVRAEAISFTQDALYAQLGIIYRFGHKQTPQEPEPAPQPEAIDECHGLTGILKGVNFLLDSAELTDEAVSILDGVATTLARCETVPIHITAHTDSTGTDEYNIDLSQRRADSVLDHLRNRGIDSSRMSSEVFGESMPIDTNDTEEGRSRNRRVELKTR